MTVSKFYVIPGIPPSVQHPGSMHAPDSFTANTCRCCLDNQSHILPPTQSHQGNTTLHYTIFIVDVAMLLYYYTVFNYILCSKISQELFIVKS